MQMLQLIFLFPKSKKNFLLMSLRMVWVILLLIHHFRHHIETLTQHSGEESACTLIIKPKD